MEMATMFRYLTELMTTHSGMFLQTGYTVFRAFAVIMIVWFGVKSALASASGQGGFRLDQFAELVMVISIGYAMLNYYSAPIPGVGLSFYQLFTRMAERLSNDLNNGLTDEVLRRLSQVYLNLETPWLTAAIFPLEAIRFVIVGWAIVLSEGALYIIISFGYIATAVGILLGPVFIPFLIVPGMEWIFWGWLKYLVQYSFYPVVANAYVSILGNMILNFTDGNPPPYDGAKVAVMFAPFLILLVAFVYGLIRVPSLLSDLFAGRAGHSVVPKV